MRVCCGCRLWQGLRCYGEFVREKLINIENLQVQDPRSPQEQARASLLDALQAHEESDISLPVEGHAPTPSNDTVKILYERATAPPIPSPPPTPQPRRTKADWERDERELADERMHKAALREFAVPSYFDSELGKAFILTQVRRSSPVLLLQEKHSNHVPVSRFQHVLGESIFKIFHRVNEIDLRIIKVIS